MTSVLAEAFFDYGGVLNSSFVNNTGERSSESAMSGYVWSVIRKDFIKGHAVEIHTGFSFEKADDSLFLLNQAFIAYPFHKGRVQLGRDISAASRLFRDLSDYGAVGVGLDNNPINFFVSGGFPNNVAQQLVQPFANRVSLYYTPFDFLSFGISYAPHISRRHTAGYIYSLGQDLTHELSGGVVTEWIWKNQLVGTTIGYSHGRYQDPVNFIGGDAHIAQLSFYLKEEKTKNKEVLYEFGYGCL